MPEDSEITRIRDLITKAFDGVERGDGVTIHEARAIDDGKDQKDREAVRAIDTEVRWQDVPSNDIQQLTDALGFMDDSGFRYYIPAYMCWSLQNWRTTKLNSASYTIDILTYMNSPKQRKLYKSSRDAFNILNQEQHAAVRDFLQYMNRVTREKYSQVSDSANKK